MSYKVLYRKYRPSNFDEVAGQKAIVQTLSNALKSGKISHAYLFCGPRGTGKTTMAKLFAKAINCEEGKGEICNKCDNCLSANKNAHPDIIEIDAASNTGIEDVRSIIEKVKFSPIKGKYKIYIIDEVHMMSNQAFNALLKTLEEPPAHVIFILATTEPHKVLPTILSRCQRYDFSKIDENEIVDYLMKILDKEGVTYEANALTPIVKIADGGMRDALMMLDQVLSYANKKINEKDVLELFGIASLDEKIDLLINIANKNINNVLNKANFFLEGGIDIQRLLASLVDILKDLLIYQETGEFALLTSLKERDVKRLLDFYSTSTLNKMIDILLKSESDFKYVANPKSLFEITLLKLVTMDKDEIAPLTLKKEENETMETIDNKENDSKVEEDVKIEIDQSAQLVNEGETNKIDDDTLIKIMVSGDKDERMRLSDIWSTSLNRLTSDPQIGKFALLLLDATPYVICKNYLILTYDFSRLADKTNIKANQKNLSAIIESMIKRKVFVYALNRTDGLRLRNLFLNLRQINKLPDKEEIAIKEE